MKIRNKKTGAEYKSPHLYFNDKYNCWMNKKTDSVGFFPSDGWEQVEEDKWHDLIKNPTDLPSDDMFVLCCTEVEHERYYKICFYEEHGGFYLGWYSDEDILAWREIPKFEEE